MSTMTKTKAKSPKSLAKSAKQPQKGRILGQPTEAPDRGIERLYAEAPDAGETRQAQWDNDFTHGRSQS